MSDPDDIDKLLRDLEAFTAGTPDANSPAQRQGGASTSPVAQPAGQVSQPGDDGTTGGRRGVWAAACSAGGFIAGGGIGTVLAILPFLSPLDTAVGAAIGAGLAGLASRPPRWFTRG